MGDIFIRGIQFPLTIEGATALDSDGNYNVYINTLLSEKTQKRTIRHELNHIRKEHFYDYEPVIHNELEANLTK